MQKVPVVCEKKTSQNLSCICDEFEKTHLVEAPDQFWVTSPSE